MLHFSRNFYLNFQVYWHKVLYLIHLFNFCRNCSDVLCCLSDVGYFLSFFPITLPRFTFSKNQVELCRYFRFLVPSCLPLYLLFPSFYFLWAQFSILFLIFLVEYSAHWSIWDFFNELSLLHFCWGCCVDGPLWSITGIITLLHPIGGEWGLVTQFCCFHFLTSQICPRFYPNIRLCCHGAPLKHRSRYLTHIIEKEKSSLAPHCFHQKAQIFSSATRNLNDWPLPVPPASLSPFLLGTARSFTPSSTCFFLVSISFCQSWPAGSLQAEPPGYSVWLHGVHKKLDLDTFRWGLYPLNHFTALHLLHLLPFPHLQLSHWVCYPCHILGPLLLVFWFDNSYTSFKTQLKCSPDSHSLFISLDFTIALLLAHQHSLSLSCGGLLTYVSLPHQTGPAWIPPSMTVDWKYQAKRRDFPTAPPGCRVPLLPSQAPQRPGGIGPESL